MVNRCSLLQSTPLATMRFTCTVLPLPRPFTSLSRADKFKLRVQHGVQILVEDIFLFVKPS